MEFILDVKNENREAIFQLLKAWQKIGLVENFTEKKVSNPEQADSLAKFNSTNQKNVSDLGYEHESFFMEHYRDLVD